MLRGSRHLLRLVAIARTLARHDALAPLADLLQGAGAAPIVLKATRSFFGSHDRPGRPGEKLAAALTDLGPAFIKLGQLLSTRTDLLGEQVAADLAQLRDRLPPFPAAAARAHHRARTRPADRTAVRFVRRQSGVGSLDRAGALRAAARGRSVSATRGGGQGPAPRHRGGLPARHRHAGLAGGR